MFALHQSQGLRFLALGNPGILFAIGDVGAITATQNLDPGTLELPYDSLGIKFFLCGDQFQRTLERAPAPRNDCTNTT